MKIYFGMALGLAAACFLATSSAVAEDKRAVIQPQSVMPEVATEGLTPTESAARQIRLSDWLSGERPSAVVDQPVQVALTDDEIQTVEHPVPINFAPLKVGVNVALTEPIVLQGLVAPEGGLPDDGASTAGGRFWQTRNADFAWAVNLGSAGAGGVRLHIEDMFLPANAELYFYSDSGETNGPITGTGPDNTGEFWTPSVIGESGTLQIHFSAPVTAGDLASVTLRVTEVGHISRSFFGIGDNNGDGGVASFCSYNASCIQNNQCVNESAVNNAELAVAKMLWTQGCCIYTCSGALIADSDSGTQIPYFMTANHCINNNSSNLEAFFRYQVSCGTSNCTATYVDPPNNLIAGKTVGASVRASGSAGDYTLFQLSQAPPAGSVFLGWNNADIANTNGAVLHRVSHPSGAPQAYTRSSVDTSAPTCQGWPRGNRIYSRDNMGATEGGSSGSPIVNASGQFVGQLTGACGFNLNNVCDNASNATVDGAFAFYYTSVAPFLASSGGCGAVGSSCSSNSQCCSNRCRGGTCR